MKLIIDIPKAGFDACKLWVKNGVASWKDEVIANGKPYEEKPKVANDYDTGYQEGHIDGVLQGEKLYARTIGEWILKKTNYDDGGNNFYECSSCHYSDVHAGSAEVPYCWHCGAKMEKETQIRNTGGKS